MIVGTGGHWTRSLFNGTTPRGMDGILNLFDAVTKKWADRVQTVVGKANDDCLAQGIFCQEPHRRVVVRDYLPGHDNCRNAAAPTTEIPLVYSDYDWLNWKYIPSFNKVWEVGRFFLFFLWLILTLRPQVLLGGKRYRDIDYLPIGRPGMLRPDGVSTTCYQSFNRLTCLKARYWGLSACHDRDGYARRLDALYMALYHARVFVKATNIDSTLSPSARTHSDHSHQRVSAMATRLP